MAEMTGLDGLKVAMYRQYPKPRGEPRVSDFIFIGHARACSIPKELPLEEIIKLELFTSKQCVYFGRAWGNDLWVALVKDPLSDELCMWRPATECYFHDVIS